MIRILQVLMVSILIAGCSGEDRIPEDVIKPEEMRKVMWDVFMAETFAQVSSNSDTTVVLSDKIKELTREALDIHDLTEKEFFRSYDWYVDHPSVFNPILDSLYAHKSAENSDDYNETNKTDSQKYKIIMRPRQKIGDDEIEEQ